MISAAYESLQRIDPIRDLPSFSTIKKRALELRRQRLEADHHNNQIDSDLITLAEAEISELKRNIEEWQALAHGEESERRRIEKERDQMRSQVGWLRDRIHQLETLRARDRGGDIDQDIVIPESLDELKDWAERELPGLVTITGRAARAARDGVYRDISLVYRCVLLLAREYRTMRVEGGTNTFNAKCQELGVELSRTFAGAGAGEFGDQYVLQYKNRNQELKWHLKKGNDHDQRNCLRVYFFLGRRG